MSAGSLKKRLSALNVWSISFGCIIGFGAFVMPGTVFLRQAGPFGTMLAMEAGAVIMLIMSYSYGYMIGKFPETGGEFIYAGRAFGRTHGFICAWFLGLCYIMIIPMNATALCLVFRAQNGNILQFGFHYKFAGYDVYMGEVMLALAALGVFAWVSSLGVNVAGRVQTVFVMLLLAGVLMILAGTLLNTGIDAEDLLPMFRPEGERSILAQIVSVLVIAPWAYVGFDTVPQLSEETNFSHDRVKSIMDTSIMCGCFVYVVLAMLAASNFPEGYTGWPEYIDALPDLVGISGIATFSASYKVLGRFGVFCISVSALMAMLTGMLGFYIATSRLLYSMARKGMIPAWFSGLNRNSVPFRAVLFCAGVSVFAPFVGRNALGWTVDMSSLGGAVSLAYTALSAVKFARLEGRRDIVIFGGVGFAFSVMFAVLLLVPVKGLDCSLAGPSYVLLVVWVILGVIFYRYTRR